MFNIPNKPFDDYTISNIFETFRPDGHDFRYDAGRELNLLLASLEADGFTRIHNNLNFRAHCVMDYTTNDNDQRYKARLLFQPGSFGYYHLAQFDVYDAVDDIELMHLNFETQVIYRHHDAPTTFVCLNNHFNCIQTYVGFRPLTDADIDAMDKELEEQVARPLITVIVKGGVVQSVYSSIEDPFVSVIDLDAINVIEEEVTLQVQDQFKVF